MSPITFTFLATLVKSLCNLSAIYILFSPMAMWIYLGLCILSGIEGTWIKYRRKNKIYI